MPKKIALSNLNANSIDIMNVIRANGSYNYQSLVPEVSTEADIPVVGEDRSECRPESRRVYQ